MKLANPWLSFRAKLVPQVSARVERRLLIRPIWSWRECKLKVVISLYIRSLCAGEPSIAISVLLSTSSVSAPQAPKALISNPGKVARSASCRRLRLKAQLHCRAGPMSNSTLFSLPTRYLHVGKKPVLNIGDGRIRYSGPISSIRIIFCPKRMVVATL